MSGRYNLDKIKADLQAKAALEGLAEGDSSAMGKMRRELERAPIKVMIDQVNYIDKNLLPAIKKKGGETSADYVFFKSLCDSLLWAVLIKDRFDLAQRLYGSKVLELEVTRGIADTYKRELEKYTTTEDVWLTEALSFVIDGLKARAEALLNKKTK
jgi:hypothetical protein